MKLKIAAALLALPLLAACAPEIESAIRVQDIVAVAGNSTSLSVPAILRVPQGSRDECERGLQQLIANLKALAPASGNGRCVEKTRKGSTDQLAEIETEMVIATPDAAFDKKNLFLLEVRPRDADNVHDLTFRLVRPIEEIVRALSVGADQMPVELDPALFLFTLDNDSAAGVSFVPNQVFLDGEPALPEMGPVTLERGKHVEIRFSDVASAYVERANAYRLATLTIAQ